MQINNKKIISLMSVAVFLGLFAAPVALAMECDKDSDGYVVIPQAIMKTVSPDTAYDENGNYSPAQWMAFFNTYKNAQLTDAEKCDGMNFKKGAEPSRCDALIIGPASGVYDPSKVTTTIQGSQVNPGAFDIPDNGIDEDCSGADSSLVATTGAGAKDLSGLSDKVVGLLSKAVVVVSILIMIWGGVMYSTAAGDEAKTSKARKAIIGAVIGLAVGLLAPAVVNWIATSLK